MNPTKDYKKYRGTVTTTTDLATKLAGMRKPCHHDKVQAWDVPEGLAQCPDCDGSGEVYLFPDVVRRPRCQKVGKSHWHFSQHYPAKSDCSQGYTASELLETWHQAAFEALPLDCIEVWRNFTYIRDNRGTPIGEGEGEGLLAFLQALEQAVKEKL